MTIGNSTSTMQPTFIGEISADDNCIEGEAFYLIVQVEPANDEKMQVEWTKDGKPVSYSSRFGCNFERGYAAIQFESLELEDSGEYQCIAKNTYGQDQSHTHVLKVKHAEDCSHEDNVRSKQLSDNLASLEFEVENALKRETETLCTEVPKFIKNLTDDIHIFETEPFSLECVIEPARDDNLHVQWLKDGQEIAASNRVDKTYERGHATLTINYSQPNHSGIYKCVAVNANGHAESNSIIIKIESDQSIITSSNISEESVEYLKSLDSGDNLPSYGIINDMPVMQAPIFIVKPQQMEAVERASARILVKVDGYPIPSIEWSINGEPIIQNSQLKVYNDGPISVLDIQRCELEHAGDITVVARNNQGEVTAATILKVHEFGDFRPDLKHVAPGNPFKKMTTLKKVGRSDELVKKLTMAKPTADDLNKLEQLSLNKGRTLADLESIQVENVYRQVQQSLKSSGHY